MKNEVSKDHLLIIKSAEEEGWPSAGTDLVTIPPLGSENKDGEPTSSDDNSACEDDATYKKSQPNLPAFEVLFGHTVVNFKEEPDKIDSQDTSRPKRYIRGHDVYSGNMEFDKPENENRLDEAINGQWDPEKLMTEPFRHFRVFEIWALRNPRDTNDKIVLHMGAVKCDLLVKHYGVIFDSIEESDEGAVRQTIPLSRTYFRKFNNHTFPTEAQSIYSNTGDTPGSYSPDAQPREHTRLNIVMDNLAGSGTVTINGTNIYKQPVSIVFTAADGSFLSQEYIDVVDEIVVSPGITAVDIDLWDYDYTIHNPALKS